MSGSITVSVDVTSADGETASATQTIQIITIGCLVGGNDRSTDTDDDNILDDLNFTEEGYSIYPNPVSKILTIKFPENKEDINLIIMDITGKTVQEASSNHKNSMELDISNFADGKYILKIKDAQETSLIKFLKISN